MGFRVPTHIPAPCEPLESWLLGNINFQKIYRGSLFNDFRKVFLPLKYDNGKVTLRIVITLYIARNHTTFIFFGGFQAVLLLTVAFLVALIVSEVHCL